MTTVEKTEYRLENLTCASCAMKFEKNVKDLPAIEDAQVNFGASKLSFSGSATIEDLEAAGAFDGIKVVPLQNRKLEPKKPFFTRKENIVTILSLVFLIAGTMLSFRYS